MLIYKNFPQKYISQIGSFEVGMGERGSPHKVYLGSTLWVRKEELERWI
jgi:hypothetical protein